MKRFLTILLACVLTVNFLTVALAQEANDFDVWDLIPRRVLFSMTIGIRRPWQLSLIHI